MERTPVTSSLLASIAYDPALKVLEVEFKTGMKGIYQYSPVEPEKYAEMMAAKSVGSFFLKEIKAKHSCKRIDGRDSDATRKAQDDPARPENGWPDPEDVA